METRSSRMQHKKKKKSWGRRILTSLVVIIILVAGIGAYAYYKLNPANYFSSGNAITPNGSKVTAKKGVINILLLGSDQRPGDKLGHTDSMLIMHIDFNTGKISVVSLPRDTRVNVPGEGYTKLTSVQYIEQANKGTKAGIEAAVQDVSTFTGVPINYYAETNYGGLESMVNVLGTVKVNVPFDVTFTHPWYPEDQNMVIKKGIQDLDGKMVTELVHERDSVPGTDFGRQKLQERALIAIAKTAMQPQHFAQIPSLIGKSSNFLTDTNMTQADMLSCALAIKKLDLNNIKYYQLKYTTASMYDDVLQSYNDQVIVDPTSMQETMANFK